jgi:hypothetical protein
MSAVFRALCAELADALDAWQLGGGPPEDTADADLIARARAALAQPEPEAPEPGYEKGYAQEHLARLMRDAIGTETNHNVYIVAAGKILDRPEFAHVARWGTPTTEPVPVAERLPGAEDCDERGRCWWLTLAAIEGGRGGYSTFWELTTSKAAGRCASHWLPHHALPVPTPTP